LVSDETKRPPLPLNDVIMSEDDAAALIGVQPETMKRMRRLGQGPPHFAVSGHVFRYSKTRVLEWLASREVTGAIVKQVKDSES
jgi:hypothetical protein